jgi:hypothetical protein
MNCTNHPSVPAFGTCVNCNRPFCPNCLVDVQGQSYCMNCRNLAVRGPQQYAPPPYGAMPPMECNEAKEALTYALIGIICLGIILEPIAIIKALKAKELIRMNPTLEGIGKANAALAIGIIIIALNLLYFAVLIMGAASGASTGRFR